MCHTCVRARAEEQRVAEVKGCLRYICICGNILGRRSLIRGEKAYTMRTVGQCCAKLLPNPSMAFTLDASVNLSTNPGSLDERLTPRSDDDPGADLGKDPIMRRPMSFYPNHLDADEQERDFTEVLYDSSNKSQTLATPATPSFWERLAAFWVRLGW